MNIMTGICTFSYSVNMRINRQNGNGFEQYRKTSLFIISKL